MEKRKFKPENAQEPKEQTPKYLGFVRNVFEAKEKLEKANVGDVVNMNIKAGSFQERDEYVDDFRKEFKRLKMKVKIEVHPNLYEGRNDYIMTITKE